MKMTDGQLDEMAQAVRRAGNVTADRPWDEVPNADKAYYRHLVRAVLELVPDEAAKERKRWRVGKDEEHCAYGPDERRVRFWKGPMPGDPDHEACADWVARENARLDAEEAKCK